MVVRGLDCGARFIPPNFALQPVRDTPYNHTNPFPSLFLPGDQLLIMCLLNCV